MWGEVRAHVSLVLHLFTCAMSLHWSSLRAGVRHESVVAHDLRALRSRETGKSLGTLAGDEGPDEVGSLQEWKDGSTLGNLIIILNMGR